MSRLLWVRSEVFDHGVFNTSIRWTVAKVFNFIGTLRTHIPAQLITREQWLEVSTTKCKPAMTESEATACWSVFSVLQQSIIGNTSHDLDVRVIGIMLICQVFSPSRLKADQVNKNEVWNERAVGVASPRHSPRGSPKGSMNHTPLGRGSDFTTALVAFVKHHLGYFLNIVTLSLLSEPNTIAEDEFDLLGMVMCAGTTKSNPLWKASEALPDFLQNGSMPATDVKQQALKLITWNDTIYTTNTAQPVQEPAAKTLNLLNLNKATWFHRPHNADIDHLNIVDCKDSTIYVTARMAFCLISGCEGSTIVLGGVSTLCTAQNCEKVSIHVAAHCYKLENCIDTTSYLYCHIPPIITGDTRGVKLAPYNVLHSRLASVLQGSHIPLEQDFVDVWAHPVCCTAGMDETLRSRITSSEEQNSNYQFVHPTKFFPVVVPEWGPRGEPPSLVLPEVYHKAMTDQQEEMAAFHKKLSSISNDAARKKAQDALQGVFRDWLTSTGKARQLSDLAKYSMQLQQQKK
mmetsp:Transcript_57867/g.102829  ORF Transcript_57867/g.102829 Transcript_57867/m.102829 type:complete len:516 (+) Transcript_57867:26-1573(+)